MIQAILASLGRVGVEHYRINAAEEHSSELFFIRRELDTRRAKDVCKYTVTVYRDFSKKNQPMRGSSTILIHPNMSEKELDSAVSDAYYAASLVRNPTYELYTPKDSDKKASNCAQNGSIKVNLLSDEELAAMMTAALFAPDTAEDAFLNSAELFITTTAHRIITSEGVDVKYTVSSVDGEFVVQCTTPADVEMYHSFSYRQPEPEALRAKVSAALDSVRDRARAEAGVKAGNYDIVLSGDHLYTLLGFYLERADASMIYPKYSSYAVGTHVQGENVTGELLNISVLPDEPYSPEGIPMPERRLIENGQLRQIHGGNRFCRYLGVQPVGSYSRMKVENGTLPFDELKRGCLYVVSFSDFQTDSFSGHFAGEIRLAYLFDNDGGVTLITGGSINGSLLECGGSMTFSTERYTSSLYDGPFAVRLRAVSVAGCDAR